MDFERPGTSSGGRPRTSGRPGTARPGTSTGATEGGAVPAFGQTSTSSNVPAFGSAYTPNVSSSRPGTNGVRRGGGGSRAGTAFSFRSVALNPEGVDYIYEDDEWDDDESDDGMVFAFMPRELMLRESMHADGLC
jgi:hypothetical protein